VSVLPSFYTLSSKQCPSYLSYLRWVLNTVRPTFLLYLIYSESQSVSILPSLFTLSPNQYPSYLPYLTESQSMSVLPSLSTLSPYQCPSYLPYLLHVYPNQYPSCFPSILWALQYPSYSIYPFLMNLNLKFFLLLHAEL